MIISWNAPSSSCMLELENDRLLLLSFPWCPRPLNQRIILLSSISWIYRLVQSLWCFNFLITTLRFLSTNICLSMSLLIMMIVLPNWVDLAVDNSHLRAGHDLQFSSVIDKCQPPGSGGPVPEPGQGVTLLLAQICIFQWIEYFVYHYCPHTAGIFHINTPQLTL